MPNCGVSRCRLRRRLQHHCAVMRSTLSASSAEVIGDLLDGDAALHIARQGAEDFRVVGPAQQVEQGFVVVFLGRSQRGQAQCEVALEIGSDETLGEHRAAGQFVDHTGMHAAGSARASVRRPIGRSNCSCTAGRSSSSER